MKFFCNKCACLWVAVFLITLFISPMPGALADDSFDLSLAGFTTGTKAGLTLSGGPILYNATAVTEIDGDSSNGLEIVAAGTDGRLYIVNSSGVVTWEKDTPIAKCNGYSDSNKVLSSPAVGDILGTGEPHIVIGQGGLGSKACKGGVVSYNARTGKRHAFFNGKAFFSVGGFLGFYLYRKIYSGLKRYYR